MEGRFWTGQSPQWAVVPMEKEEEKKRRKGNELTKRNSFVILML